MHSELIDTLIVKNQSKIVFLIMDGLGGLPMPGRDETELEAAHTPNLDALAKNPYAACSIRWVTALRRAAVRHILHFSAMIP